MRDLLIQLNLLPGVGTARLEGLVRAFESLAAFRRASVEYLTALGLPAEWKLHQDGRPEKAILRRAFETDLPMDIINRPKQKFSKGAGSSELIAERAAETIDDAEFAVEAKRLGDEWDYDLPSKEALHYYKILRQFYCDEWILPNMGQSRSI